MLEQALVTILCSAAAIVAVAISRYLSWLQQSQGQARSDAKQNQIHDLVNSAMGRQLRINAELARWKANTTKEPIDITAADEAEKLYRQHEEKANGFEHYKNYPSSAKKFQ
jgi:hypothetical protein